MASLRKRDVYDLVAVESVPVTSKVISSRFVNKAKADGTLKSRLVGHGWGQRPGVDCGVTFSPVCRLDSERLPLAIATEKD